MTGVWSIGRWVIVIVWCVLVVGLIRRDMFITSVTAEEQRLLTRADREEYQGVYFRDAKIGYVVNTYGAGEGGLMHIDQRAEMRINVAQVEQPIGLQLSADLFPDSRLKRFSFSFISPLYKMSANGEVKDSVVEFELTTGNSVIRNKVAVQQAPVISTVRRGYLLREGLAEGEKGKGPSFDPLSLTARDTVVEYRGRDKVLINGRVLNLHRFREVFAGVGINFWLDDTGDVVKEESPAGFVFIKEPKFKALEKATASEELLSSVAVRPIGAIPDFSASSFVQYRLELPEGDFDLEGGRQSFVDGVLTIAREVPGPGSGCGDTGSALAASPYIQADNPRIIRQAEEILAGERDAKARVERLAHWVYDHVEKRPVLGIPDAVTTLNAGVGDCNEHAALFAALARSAGIPTHIAAGVVYHRDAFYYHAWNEVCVDGHWLALDTTTDQLPADVSHIRFLRGELEEQIRIGALLGNLGIEVLAEGVDSP